MIPESWILNIPSFSPNSNAFIADGDGSNPTPYRFDLESLNPLWGIILWCRFKQRQRTMYPYVRDFQNSSLIDLNRARPTIFFRCPYAFWFSWGHPNVQKLSPHTCELQSLLPTDVINRHGFLLGNMVGTLQSSETLVLKVACIDTLNTQDQTNPMFVRRGGLTRN